VLQLGNGELANFEASTSVKAKIDELREADVADEGAVTGDLI